MITFKFAKGILHNKRLPFAMQKVTFYEVNNL